MKKLSMEKRNVSLACHRKTTGFPSENHATQIGYYDIFTKNFRISIDLAEDLGFRTL